MIQLKNKKDCCGCGACVQRCPKKCISMSEDEEGFLYPIINNELCIDCGLCEKVCPVININDSRKPLAVYAGKNPDEDVRLQSSSGGFFSILAEQIIEDGGVVFGVGYNEHWEAVHTFTETKEGLTSFRMSKYIQSVIGTSYKETESFLKQGRKVLFSGTPCQIAGLRKYLRKDYNNLYTLDIICHGVPSPGVFRWYLGEEFIKISRKKGNVCNYSLIPIYKIPKLDVVAEKYGFEIKEIRFRDKKKGWKNYSFVLNLSKLSYKNESELIISNEKRNNSFLKGFQKDLYLRPSCYECPVKNLKSGSDITLGDWWGINNIKPELDDDKGISALIVNTNKGFELIEKQKYNLTEMDYEVLCINNPSLIHSTKLTSERQIFYSLKNLSFSDRVQRLCFLPLKKRLKIKIRNFLKKIKVLS